jgi:hypothetical protein
MIMHEAFILFRLLQLVNSFLDIILDRLTWMQKVHKGQMYSAIKF